MLKNDRDTNRRWIPLLVACLLLSAHAWASCTTSTLVTTPDLASVQACVNAAATGQTVSISGGSATYSSTVTINKGITVQVAAGATVTLTSSSSTSPPFFTIQGTGAAFVRLSGDNGSAANCKTNSSVCGLRLIRQNDSTYSSMAIHVIGLATAFRIDHVYGSKGDAFLYTNDDATATGAVAGVIDHSWLEDYGRTYFAQDQRSTDNTYESSTYSASRCVDGSSNGATAWYEFLGHENTYAGASGQNKMVYFEDNTFNWTGAANTPYPQGQGAFYSQYGGKVAARYNVFNNWSPFIVEEGDNPACGTVFYEIYQNTFNEKCVQQCQQDFDLRSGQLLIHDNTFTNVDFPGHLVFELTTYPNGTENWNHTIKNTFIWNNTVNGVNCQDNVSTSGAACAGIASDSQSAHPPVYYLRPPNQVGDVYYGYTPLTYPHPLVTGAVPPAPTGLSAVVH